MIRLVELFQFTSAFFYYTIKITITIEISIYKSGSTIMIGISGTDVC